MSAAGKWGYSLDEEMYYGRFDTPEDAVSAAVNETECGRQVTVGQFVDPIQPEKCIDYDSLFERVWCQDDYSGDWAADCISPTQKQEEELVAEVSKVMAAWLDKHGLRPEFGIIDSSTVRRIEITEEPC